MPDYDVIVVGAGNAALAAAVSAREQGASRVLALEKAPRGLRGGNTFYSGALLRFAFDGADQLRALAPDAAKERPELFDDVGSYPKRQFLDDLMDLTEGRSDPELADLLVGRSYDTVRWMVAQGIELEPDVDLGGVKVGGKVAWPSKAVLRARNAGVGLSGMWFGAAERQGVEIRYETKAVRLLQDKRGRVTALTVQDGEGFHDLSCKSVVLACGGFEANPEWRARYLGRPWDLVKVRGTRYNTGDGLRMALEVGALAHGQWTGAHATPIDASAPVYGDRALTDKTNRLSYPFGVMVNSRGLRFVNEGEDVQLRTYAKIGGIVLNQPSGLAYQLFDAKAIPLLEPRYATSKPLQADSLEALVEQLPVERDTCRRTLEEYNAAVEEGPFDPTGRDGLSTRGLEPPKTNWAQPLDTPPFVAYPVSCGITFTFGGLRVTENAQVMGTDWRPIPGLYTCGEMVGGLFHFSYPGGSGLVSGAVFGRLAGAAAAG